MYINIDRYNHIRTYVYAYMHSLEVLNFFEKSQTVRTSGDESSRVNCNTLQHHFVTFETHSQNSPHI